MVILFCWRIRFKCKSSKLDEIYFIKGFEDKIQITEPDASIFLVYKSLYLVDLLGEHEVKPFFISHNTEIFYVFYEEFTNLEFSGKSKGEFFYSFFNVSSSGVCLKRICCTVINYSTFSC